MKKRNGRKFLAFLILAADLIGLAAVFGVFEGSFHGDRIQSFTVVSALNVLIYYLFVQQYLRKGGQEVYIPGWRFGVLVSSTFMALYTWLFLQPVYVSAEASIQLGMVILDGLLPVLVLLDWASDEKRHFRKRFIPVGMFIPVVYLLVALIAGACGHGLGYDGRNWPYPMLNADQLGWKLVLESSLLIIVLLWLYCCLLVKIDRSLGRRRAHRRRHR